MLLLMVWIGGAVVVCEGCGTACGCMRVLFGRGGLLLWWLLEMGHGRIAASRR